MIQGAMQNECKPLPAGTPLQQGRPVISALHTWDTLPCGPRERLTSSCVAENLRALLTSQLRSAPWCPQRPREAVAAMPALVLTTHDIFRKHLCFCFLFPFCSAVTAPAMLMLIYFFKFLQSLWRSPASFLSIVVMLHLPDISGWPQRYFEPHKPSSQPVKFPVATIRPDHTAWTGREVCFPSNESLLLVWACLQ